MLRNTPPQSITDLVVTTLVAYHKREVDRLQTIIDLCGNPNQWQKHWPEFLAASENEEEALCAFTQFVMTQLES